MGATTFDPLTAAPEMEAIGIDRAHAVTVAKVVHQAVTADDSTLGEFATKSDLASGLAGLVARLEARLYRALWIQGGAIVAAVGTIVGVILAVLRFLPVPS